MKKALLILGLICFMAVPSLVVAAECADPAKSPIGGIVTVNGKDIKVCNIREAYLEAFVKREGAKADDLNNRVVPIQAKDYTSKKMFNAYDGFYIIEHTMNVANAGKAPYIIGFSSRERAWKYWEDNVKKIGGRVVNFETATREFYKDTTGPSAKSKKKMDAAAGHVDKLLKKRQ